MQKLVQYASFFPWENLELTCVISGAGQRHNTFVLVNGFAMCKTGAMQNELIDTKTAAQLCNRSYATITRWAVTGKLKPVHKGEGIRGAYVFKKTDVVKQAEALKAEKTAA